jgi:ion channel
MNPDLPMLRIGLPMVIATGVIQVVAQLILAQAMETLPLPPQSRYPKFLMLTHSVLAVTILMVGHIVQVILWACVYHFYWDEFTDFAGAVYFSLANFTTVGATGLALPPDHRLVGALESAAGMLMFGWSTALLVAVVQRTYHRKD